MTTRSDASAAVAWRVPPIGVRVEQLSDEALLAGLGSGDEKIASVFVRRFQSKVYGIAVSVLGDARAAEDVAQQTFERAWRQAHTFDPLRGSVGGWLGTIARNLAIDASRVRRPLPVDPADLLGRFAPSFSGPEDRALQSEDARSLWAALDQLPVAQARAIVLSGLGGMSASQVAEAEGIPLGTAKTRIRGAMMRLRDVLSGEAAADA